MIHTFWSFFYLLSTTLLILLYVLGAYSLLSMMHYIVKNNWQSLDERGFSPVMKSFEIGGKFLFFVLGPALLTSLVFYIDYNVRDIGEVYDHKKISDTAILYIFIFQVGVYLCFVLNTKRTQRLSIIHQKKSEKSFLKLYFSWKGIKKVILPTIACVLVVYGLQLQKWTGEDNAHYDAKKYWASGQVLNGFRLILTRFIHPEHLILQPLEYLQREIYTRGSTLLPENDGEIGVWKNLWFIYHYSSRGRDPLFIKQSKPSTKMIELLDAEWFCLETMATKPFADQQMKEEHYLRDYPTLAFSHNLHEGWYTGRLIQSHREIAKMPKYVIRSQQLSDWLWQLRKKWDSSDYMQKFIAKHPKVEALWQAAFLFKLEDVIHGSIFSRNFDCDDKYMHWYLIVRKELTEGKENQKSVIERMNSRTQAERLYKLVVERIRHRKIKYYVQHYCRINVGGDDGLEYYAEEAKKSNTTVEKIAMRWVINTSNEEIPILEEIFND